MSRTVEVRVAGQNYRVVSSAPEAEVRRLVGAVNAKLAEVVPQGRAAPPNALLLAAIALAHEVEEERARREALEQRTRGLLGRALTQIDEVLREPDGVLHAPDAVTGATDAVTGSSGDLMDAPGDVLGAAAPAEDGAVGIGLGGHARAPDGAERAASGGGASQADGVAADGVAADGVASGAAGTPWDVSRETQGTVSRET